MLDPESEPRPAGSAVAPVAQAGSRLKKQYDLNQYVNATGTKVQRLLKRIKVIESIEVVDVGQANLVRFLVKEKRKTKVVFHLYVDIGEPVPFHRKTVPATVLPVPPEKSLVILTHWDWDHVAMGRQRKNGDNRFAEVKWIAPAQIVGPNTFSRIVEPQLLRRKLPIIKVRNTPINCGCFDLHFGQGSSRNDSGLGVIARRGKSRYLMPGDAQLGKDGLQIPGAFDGLVVAHHGAMVGGNVPAPSIKGSVAALSVGFNNNYGHPHRSTVNALLTAGWYVLPTYRYRMSRRYPSGTILL